MTSPLVPWNSCGAYMTGVLGVSTMQYAPWALFNYLNPLVAVGYAITGFRVERIDDGAAVAAEAEQAPPHPEPSVT